MTARTLAIDTERWLDRAAEFDRFGCPGIAAAFRECAADVRKAEDRRASELLSQTAAAREAGVSPSTMRRWEREKRLTNRGQPNVPRYRRDEVLAARGREGNGSAWEAELIDARTG